MRHHDHPGHPEDPEHVHLNGHPDHPYHSDLPDHSSLPEHDEHLVRLDPPARDGGRHRKGTPGRGSRRRAPQRPGFRTAVTAA
ncbi:hypothetical protein AB0E71_35485, partial [Streptomyces narbonensis]